MNCTAILNTPNTVLGKMMYGDAYKHLAYYGYIKQRMHITYTMCLSKRIGGRDKDK